MKKKILVCFLLISVLTTLLSVSASAAGVDDYRVEYPRYEWSFAIGQTLDFSNFDGYEEISLDRANACLHIVGQYAKTGNDANFYYGNVNQGRINVSISEEFEDQVDISINVAGSPVLSITCYYGIITDMFYDRNEVYMVYPSYVTIYFNDYYTKADGSKLYNTDESLNTFLDLVSDISEGNFVYNRGMTASGLFGYMFESVGIVFNGLGDGMKSSVRQLIYENGVSGQLSSLVIFIFVIAGLSIAMTVFFLIWRLIRFKRQR